MMGRRVISKGVYLVSLLFSVHGCGLIPVNIFTMNLYIIWLAGHICVTVFILQENIVGWICCCVRSVPVWTCSVVKCFH